MVRWIWSLMADGCKTLAIKKSLLDQQDCSGTSNTWGSESKDILSNIYQLKIIADSLVKKPFGLAIGYENNIMLWDQTIR